MAIFNWMRILKIKLSNDNGEVIEYVDDASGNGLNIEVDGHKYLSAIKDDCTVTISNLTYTDVVKLIEGKFYNIEVICGYKTSGTYSIFKGGVLYISNKINTDRSNDVIFICASQFVARAGQTRINLSPKSGVNYYSLIQYLNDRNLNINMSVSESLKNERLETSMSENTTMTNWITLLLSEKPEYGVNVDATDGYSLSIFNIINDERKVHNISNAMINLSEGFPRLSTTGVSFSVMPTKNYHCGDIVKIDNSLINMAVTSKDEAYRYYGNYLDQNGEYMIYEIDFNLENRGQAFNVSINAKSLNLLKQVTQS